jgi:anti-sigma factor RsiW
MTDHLSHVILNALVDGELTPDQMANADQHLAGCPSCTSYALNQSLLKSATGKAGKRYQPPPHLQERLARLASQEGSRSHSPGFDPAALSPRRPFWGFGSQGWAAAAVILLVSVSMMLFQRAAQRAEIASAQHAALITEVFDQHVATLADNIAPQVVSTDRHTVKPWFQGKIPFSFNLPQTLPGDTTLDGANLTYLGDQPVAQLLYSIGRHRVSVFLRQSSAEAETNQFAAERAGFHVMAFSTNGLEGVAVSDVDPARLAELVSALKRAQTGAQPQSK